MPPAKKRKIAVEETAFPTSQDLPHVDKESKAEPSGDSQPDFTSADKTQERKERFKALQARAVSFSLLHESEWPSTDPCVAKIRSEEPQRSSRRVTATGDRP